MTTMLTYAAALDSSTSVSSLVVAAEADGAVRVAAHDLPAGRESAQLLPALLARLAAADVAVNAIRRWTVGMGPGSFTGLRLGAALVKGLGAGNGAVYRGLPSSLALVLAANPEPDEELAALYDGRRGEVIVSRFRGTGGDAVVAAPALAVPLVGLAEYPVSRFVILATDPVAGALPPAVRAKTVFVDRLDAGLLLRAQPQQWPGSLAEAEASMTPVYVRPASFVAGRAPNPRVAEWLAASGSGC